MNDVVRDGGRRALTLRGRLTALLLLSLLPAFMLILIGAALERDRDLADARTAARQLTNAAAMMVERLADVANQALTIVAAAPPVRALDRDQCTPFLRALYGSYPEFLNFGVIDATGRVLCSTLPLEGEVDLADRDYIQFALSSGRFAVSTYFIGRITGRGGIAFAQPLKGPDGSVFGAVYVTAHLDELSRLGARLEPEPGMVLAILDRHGTVIGHYPNWIGHGEPMTDPRTIAQILADATHEAVLVGSDGVVRRHVVRRAEIAGEGSLYATVGVDEAEYASVARHALYLGAAAVVVVGAMGALIVYVGVGRMLAPRIRRITRAAERFMHGDLSARVGPIERRDELGAIAQAFDGLAEAVESRERLRQAAHAELEASQRLNAAILDSLDAHIAVLDEHGTIIAVNARWREFARWGGASEHVMQGVGVDYLAACEAGPDELGLAARSGIAEVLAGRSEGFLLEYPCHSAEVERWFILRATPLRGGGGAVVAHVDISARKRSEQRMVALLEELERSNRDLQDFAYVASHDLQEPLRKITAFSERLRTAAAQGLGARELDYLDRMASAAARMQRLIGDLLEFSRVATQARPMQRVALDRIVADVLSDLEERIRTTGAEIRVGLLPELDADETQMRQAFLNLVGNALKFVRAGAKPVVSIEASWPRPGETRICVADNGIGIPAEARERIFAPFVRLHARSEYEGSGMGLAVVRRIVDRHGGRISVQSAAGQGTRFCLDLPLIQGESQAETARRPE